MEVIYPFILVILIITLMALTQRNNRRAGQIHGFFNNNYLWFGFFWLIQYLIVFSGAIQFEQPTLGITYTIVGVVHIGFFVGLMLANAFKGPRAPVKPRPLEFQNFTWLLFLLATLGVIFCFIRIADYLVSNGLDLYTALSMSEANRLRQENLFGLFQSKLGKLFLPVYVFSTFPMLVVALIAFVLAGKGPSQKLPLPLLGLVFLGALLFVFDALFISLGRGGLLLMIVVIFSSWMIGKGGGQADALLRPTKTNAIPKTRRGLPAVIASIVLLPLLVIGFMSFQASRDGRGQSAVKMQQISSGSSPGPLIEAFTINDATAERYSLQLSYLASSTNILNRYPAASLDISGPYYGMYNFTIPISIISELNPSLSFMTFQEIRNELWAPLISGGLIGNVWATSIRDVVADFGYVGGLLFFVVLGFSVQRATISAIAENSMFIAATSTFLRIICFWSCFHSQLFIGYTFWPLVASILLSMIFRSDRNRRSSIT